MSEERRKVLHMLSEGIINVDEAERLLSRLGEKPPEPTASEGQLLSKTPRYLRVEVDQPQEGQRVNVRVPMALIRTGIKLSTMLPQETGDHLKERGIDLNGLSELETEELIQALSELQVNVDSDSGETVRVFCE